MPISKPPVPARHQPATSVEPRRLAVLAVGYGVAVAGCILLSRLPGSIASVWIPNALAIALLMGAARGALPLYVLSIGASGLAANLLTGVPWTIAAPLMAANILETLVGHFALRAIGAPTTTRETNGFLRGVFVSVALPPLAGAGMAVGLLALSGTNIPGLFPLWWSGSFAGGTMVMSLAFVLMNPALRLDALRAKLFESIGIALMAIILTFLATQNMSHPFGVLLVVMTIAAIRLPPPMVAVIGTLVIATVIGSAQDLLPHAGQADAPERTVRQVAIAIVVLLPIAVSLVIAQLGAVEADLVERNQALQAISDHSPIGVGALDADGRFRHVNAALANILRLPARDIVGRHALTFVDPPSRSLAERVWRAAVGAQQDHFRIDCWLQRSDGLTVEAQLDGTAIRDMRTRLVTAFIINVQDVTAQKIASRALETAEERLTLAMENAGQAVWDADFTTGKTYYSDLWAAMLGCTRAEIGDDGEAWKAFVHPDDLAMVEAVDRDHVEGQSEAFRCEFRMRHKDGHWIWVLDRGRVVARGANGRALRMIGTHADITQRKTLEQELERAKQQAEALAHAKAHFLSVMSHELRTPLTSILGATDLILNGGTPLEAPELRRLIAIQKEAGENLLGIINDILDFRRMETGAIELEQMVMSPRDLGEKSVTLMAGLAERKGVVLTLDCASDVPSAVVGDPTRLGQILNNLISNAVKFTPPGGSIRVTFERAPDAGLRLIVADTGIGISQASIPKLFVPFQQAEANTARLFGGSGLGLAICRELSRLMGGTISAESTEGMGTRMIVTLPLPETKQEPALEVPQAPGLGLHLNVRVLLAEDNPTNGFLVSRMLERMGASVTHVDDGEKAVKAFADGEQFDIILMDIQMPNLDGIEATRRIRAMPAGSTIPIVGLTANSFRDAFGACAAAGMNAHVPKPVRWEQLHSTIAHLTGSVPGTAAQNSEPHARSHAAVESCEGIFDRTVFENLRISFDPRQVDDLITLFRGELSARTEVLDRPDLTVARASRESHALASPAGSLGFEALFLACRRLVAEAAKADAGSLATDSLPAPIAEVRKNIALAQQALDRLEAAGRRTAA